jgi:arginase
MKSYQLIPYVCGAGASTAGAEFGAIDLKKFGLEAYLKEWGVDVKWREDPEHLFSNKWGRDAHENLPPLGSDARREIVLWHSHYLKNEVEASLLEGNTPVTIGGDHSMGAGSISGLAAAKNAHGRIGVLWIDAHADMNTPDTSHTQAFHGMPVTALFGMGDHEYASLAGENSVLRPEHICFIGLRDLDEAEERYMEELGINAFYMRDVKKEGLAKVMNEALSIITSDTDYRFLSLDVDGLDPEDAPATGTAVEDGIRVAELLPLLQKTVHDIHFDGFEIAEYNPMLPGKEKTTETICSLLKTMLTEDIKLEDLKEHG